MSKEPSSNDILNAVVNAIKTSKNSCRRDIRLCDGQFWLFDNGKEQILMPHEVARHIQKEVGSAVGIKRNIEEELIPYIEQLQKEGIEESHAEKQIRAGLNTIPVFKKEEKPDFSGCFPPTVERFIRTLAEDMGVNTEGVCGIVLSVAAAALPAKYRIVVVNYCEHPTIWVCLKGQTGVKKSPTLKKCIDVFDDKDDEFDKLNEEAEQLYADEMSRYQAKLAVYQSNIEKEEKKGNDTKNLKGPKKPKEPVPKMCMMRDATIEAVKKNCAGNPRGIFYFQDEMKGWVGSNMKNDSDNERAKWLKAYDATKDTIDRVGSGRTKISCYRVVVCGGLQPGKVETLLTEGEVDGLQSRLVWVELDLEGDEQFNLTQELRDQYNRIIEKLWDAPEKDIAMTQEAQEIIVEKRKDYNRQTKALPDCHWRGFISKQQATVAKLTLILHAMWCADQGLPMDTPIPLETAQRAVKLCDKFIVPAARAIYVKAGSRGVSNTDFDFEKEHKTIINMMIDIAKTGKFELAHSDLVHMSKPYRNLYKKKDHLIFWDMCKAAGIAEWDGKRIRLSRGLPEVTRF